MSGKLVENSIIFTKFLKTAIKTRVKKLILLCHVIHKSLTTSQDIYISMYGANTMIFVAMQQIHILNI